jgi:glucokinase
VDQCSLGVNGQGRKQETDSEEGAHEDGFEFQINCKFDVPSNFILNLLLTSLSVGIDLGATRIKGVLIDSAGSVIDSSIEETREHDHMHWKAAVFNVAAALTASAKGAGVTLGLAAPGLADDYNTRIAVMPGRLQGLEGFDWSQRLGRRTWVLNDAHAALMAEASFGAAKGYKHVVMLTLGTGVGGAVLINGSLYTGKGQRAGHIGHVTVDALSEHADVAGMPGSIEDAMGDVTLHRRSKGRFESTHALLEAVKAGDRDAEAIWLLSVRQLAATLASLINLFSPEIVVLGGGIAQAGNQLFDPLEHYLAMYEWRPGGLRVPVVQARYSDLAGAIGAAAFAFKMNLTT